MKQRFLLKLIWALIPVLLLSLAAAACGSANQRQKLAAPVKVTLAVEPNPPSVGPSRLAVSLTRNGLPVDGARVEIQGNMNHEGMQPLFAVARPAADGRYKAPFVWTMEGNWQMTVTATLPGGQIAKQQFSFAVDPPAAHDDAQTVRVPNNGAAIRIVSPRNGDVFEQGQDIPVEIEVENFALGEEGRHWHVYINGRSPQMIMGKMTETALRGLEPGQYEISAFLSINTHEDMEEGAAVTISVVGSGNPSLSMEQK